MRKMRQHGVNWLCLTGFVILLALPSFASQGNTTGVQFGWAFGAIVGDDAGDIKSITEDVTLQSGDKFKILVEPVVNCFVYLFYYSSGGEVYMLFPEQPYSKKAVEVKKYYLPPADNWFELDEQSGLETLYLIASKDRFTGLENIYQEYSAAKGAEEKAGLAQELRKEIKSIKRKNRQLTSKAEKPVSIGGRLRGTKQVELKGQDALNSIKLEITADSFYSRTYTIDHR